MGQFGKSFQKFAKLGKRRMHGVAENAFIQTGTSVVIKTPVGDPELWAQPAPVDYRPGGAANSWFASIGAPVRGESRSPDPTASGSLAQIKQVAKLAPGNRAFISNSKSYIFRLEFDSWSTQAQPPAMVRMTANNWPIIVKRALRATP